MYTFDFTGRFSSKVVYRERSMGTATASRMFGFPLVRVSRITEKPNRFP